LFANFGQDNLEIILVQDWLWLGFICTENVWMRNKALLLSLVWKGISKPKGNNEWMRRKENLFSKKILHIKQPPKLEWMTKFCSFPTPRNAIFYEMKRTFSKICSVLSMQILMRRRPSICNWLKSFMIIRYSFLSFSGNAAQY
jgi:hypothetical protein